MKIILQIGGREITFSEEQLTAIVESYFTKEDMKQEVKTQQATNTPKEGQWFEVNPQSIDQTRFQSKREDEKQEKTRLLILEAFSQLNNNPEKYSRTFETMMPKKDWSSKTVKELKEMAEKLGDHNANWVEQALEWAQRICNGESWENVCNNEDTASWYRLIVWKNEEARVVGGSCKYDKNHPASDVDHHNYFPNDGVSITVPLVVRYK